MIIGYALAFLLGSIPTAYWYAKYVHKIDIRKEGSGNIGATNSLRVMGKKAGAIVLIIDLLKGLIPTLVAKKLNYPIENVLAIGSFAVLGHLYSPFVGFKGGKGIATSFGVILGFSLPAAFLALIAFGTTLKTSKYVSLSSIMGVLAFAVYTILQNYTNLVIVAITITLTTLLIYSHRENIKRLVAGTENKTK